MKAQVYDAAMMIGLAGFIGLQNPDDALNACLISLVDGRDAIPGGWTADGLSVYVQMLAAGARPDIRGASGKLDFDSKVYTNVLTTVYRHFLVYQSRYITLDHHTSDGSKRSDPTLAGWAWKAEHMQDFNHTADSPYPPLRRQKALLVAASSGWENYRHQADVYNMYRILRSEGYAAEDIIVVAEDDIARNDRNPEPGVVRVETDGPNVYEGFSQCRGTTEPHLIGHVKSALGVGTETYALHALGLAAKKVEHVGSIGCV
ncbi:MAG: C13 family peptidase [Alloprevotella sp.]|nr:C13 family peptidase [Alloprevotella sp.]